MAQIVPLYTTSGEHAAFYANGHIYNLRGEWIGFVDMRTADVYSLLGEYVGRMTYDGRILRRRVIDVSSYRKPVPQPPPPVKVPAIVPLPGLFSEVDYSTVDVLADEPYRLHTSDHGELREDMD